MDFLSIFSTWLGIFSISFTFLPLGMVYEWYKRGTSDGFSSVILVLPMSIMSLWYKQGVVTNNPTNIYINGINIVIFLFYVVAFAFYQPKRKYVIGQLLTAFITVRIIYAYVDRIEDAEDKGNTMGHIASTAQILSNGGGIYEIIRIVRMGHTEYTQPSMQYGVFLLILQWLLYGFLTNNMHIVKANIAGLLVNVATIGLFFIYPPLTWRVPIIGTGPQQKKKKENCSKRLDPIPDASKPLLRPNSCQDKERKCK